MGFNPEWVGRLLNPTSKPDDVLHGGFIDYRNTSAADVIVAGGAFGQLTNNNLSTPNPGLMYAPFGVTKVYDAITNEFDFSELKAGDQVTIRIQCIVTAGANNTELRVRFRGNTGDATEYTHGVISEYFKQTGSRPVTASLDIYLDDNQVSLPALFEAQSDNGGAVQVISYYCQIKRRG